MNDILLTSRNLQLVHNLQSFVYFSFKIFEMNGGDIVPFREQVNRLIGIMKRERKAYQMEFVFDESLWPDAATHGKIGTVMIRPDMSVALWQFKLDFSKTMTTGVFGMRADGFGVEQMEQMNVFDISFVE